MHLEKPQIHMIFLVEDGEELIIETNLKEERVAAILEDVYHYENVNFIKEVREDDVDFDDCHEEEDFIFMERQSTH